MAGTGRKGSWKALALVVALVASAVAGPGVAGAYTIPVPDSVNSTLYNDFTVYSIELLNRIATSNASGHGIYDIMSGPGQIQDHVVIYTGSSGNAENNHDASTGPFSGTPATSRVDNPFHAPSGNTITGWTLDDAAAAPPAYGPGHNTPGQWTTPVGDTAGAQRWSASIGTLVDYLNGGTLAFIFDNNQEGNTGSNPMWAWGRIQVRDGGDGHVLGCYEVNALHVGGPASGCSTGQPKVRYDGAVGETRLPGLNIGDVIPPTDTNDFDPRFVVVASGFCVNRTTGAVAPCPAAPNDPLLATTCVGANCLYGPITNNLGQSYAEFIILSDELNRKIADGTYPRTAYLSVDLRLTNLTDGPEQLFLCPNCQVPEPSVAMILGLALVGISLVGWRLSRTSAG